MTLIFLYAETYFNKFKLYHICHFMEVFYALRDEKLSISISTFVVNIIIVNHTLIC